MAMIGNGRARCYDKNWKNSVLLLSEYLTFRKKTRDFLFKMCDNSLVYYITY